MPLSNDDTEEVQTITCPAASVTFDVKVKGTPNDN